MKAIRVARFGEPEVMRLEEIPDPTPGPGQILVRLHAAGVNPVDTYIRAGKYARLPSLPFTPGMDGAGVVVHSEDDNTGLPAGTRVYLSGTLTGTYAELALCEVKNAHPLPANISFQQGAAIGTPYATAYRALFFRAQARAGETVLVHGASGGVGTAAVQLARATGLRVFGTAGTAEGRSQVQREGAHEVFDHTQAGYRQQISDATGGKGVDVILEMLANVNLDTDLGLLAKNGRVIVIGSRGRIEIDPRATMARDADIRGMILASASPAELAGIQAGLYAGLENGSLRPIVGRVFALEEAPSAHRAVMAAGARGKIVLLPPVPSK